MDWSQLWSDILDVNISSRAPNRAIRQAAAQDAAYAGLLDSIQRDAGLGAHPGMGAVAGGQGLPGLLNNEANFMEYLGRVAGIGGPYTAHAGDQIAAARTNALDHQQAMEMHGTIGAADQARLDQAADQFNTQQTTLSEYQRQMIEAQQKQYQAQQAAATSEIARARLDKLYQGGMATQDDVRRYNQNLDLARALHDAMVSAEGDPGRLTPVQQQIAINAVNKFQKPNEGVMDGDAQMVLDFMGWGQDKVEQILGALRGGRISVPMLADLYRATSKLEEITVDRINAEYAPTRRLSQMWDMQGQFDAMFPQAQVYGNRWTGGFNNPQLGGGGGGTGPSGAVTPAQQDTINQLGGGVGGGGFGRGTPRY